MVAAHQASYRQSVGQYLLLLQSVAVQAHAVEYRVVEGNVDVAIRGEIGIREVVGLELVVSADALKGVYDAVVLTVDDEEAAVIHFHPYVLRLVDGCVGYTVVHASYAAVYTRLVGIEVKAVEAHHTVPCCHPHVAVVVVGD